MMKQKKSLSQFENFLCILSFFSYHYCGADNSQSKARDDDDDEEGEVIVEREAKSSVEF
jgi:hypothetical protein